MQIQQKKVWTNFFCYKNIFWQIIEIEIFPGSDGESRGDQTGLQEELREINEQLRP